MSPICDHRPRSPEARLCGSVQRLRLCGLTLTNLGLRHRAVKTVDRSLAASRPAPPGSPPTTTTPLPQPGSVLRARPVHSQQRSRTGIHAGRATQAGGGCSRSTRIDQMARGRSHLDRRIRTRGCPGRPSRWKHRLAPRTASGRRRCALPHPIGRRSVARRRSHRRAVCRCGSDGRRADVHDLERMALSRRCDDARAEDPDRSP